MQPHFNPQLSATMSMIEKMNAWPTNKLNNVTSVKEKVHMKKERKIRLEINSHHRPVDALAGETSATGLRNDNDDWWIERQQWAIEQSVSGEPLRGPMLQCDETEKRHRRFTR